MPSSRKHIIVASFFVIATIFLPMATIPFNTSGFPRAQAQQAENDVTNAEDARAQLAQRSIYGIINVGNFPHNIAFNPSNNKMYVTNLNDDSLSILDNNTVTDTIAVGDSPLEVAFNPANGRMYATNYHQAVEGSPQPGTISVIDDTTITDTINTDIGPNGIAFNPTNSMMYLVIQSANRVNVISDTTITDTVIPVGDTPYKVAFNPSNNMMYVTNHLDNTVSVIDGTTNDVTDTIAVGNGPVGVAFNQANEKMYVANFKDNTVSVIDGTTNDVTDTIAVGNQPIGIAYNPSDSMMYVTNQGSNTVSVIDDVNVVDTTSVGNQPIGIAYNPSNKKIYIVNSYSNSISVIGSIESGFPEDRTEYSVENVSVPFSENFTLDFQDEPPEFSEEEFEELSEELESVNPYVQTPITNVSIQGPPPESETSASRSTIPVDNSSSLATNETADTSPTSSSIDLTRIIPVQFPNDNEDPRRLNIYRVSDTRQSASAVAEPSAANNGRTVFYTANWLAARSQDDGLTWRFANPNTGMAFCCDQEVLFDPSHQIFIWYRQATEDPNGENHMRVSISRDAINWWHVDIRPRDFDNTWTNQWFDYPHLALSDRSLYITTNIFGQTPAPTPTAPNPNAPFIRSAALQLPLEALARGGGFQGRAFFTDDFTLTPAQGASNVMYFGTHVGNDKIRIYEWVEGAISVSSLDRNIAPYNPTQPFSCPDPDGRNWCGRGDDRITNGWIGQEGHVGFFWSASQGNGFPYPYIDAAVFDIDDDFRYVSRPLIWKSDHAWMYAYASPKLNLLALAAFWGGGQYFPSENVAISYIGGLDTPPLSSGWRFYGLEDSTAGPPGNEWGDYIRVRPHHSETDRFLWISTGFSYNRDDPTPGTDTVHAYYAIFGRSEDAPRFTPSIEITTPVEGYEVRSLDPVSFHAEVSIDRGFIPESAIRWSSDVDGYLGTGRSISHIFENAKDGPRTITATVTYDYPAMSASDSITVINNIPHFPPSPVIVEPKQDADIAVGSTLFLKGYASTADPARRFGWTPCERMSWEAIEQGANGPIVTTLAATPDPDFQRNGLCNAQVVFSTAGVKTIRLSATNSVGDTGYTEVNVNAVDMQESNFDLSVYPSSNSLAWGLSSGPVVYHVTVTNTGGDREPVTLTVEGLPASLKLEWKCVRADSGDCTLPSFNSDLLISFASYTPPQSYPITITATSGDLTRSTSVTLYVSRVG